MRRKGRLFQEGLEEDSQQRAACLKAGKMEAIRCVGGSTCHSLHRGHSGGREAETVSEYWALRGLGQMLRQIQPVWEGVSNEEMRGTVVTFTSWGTTKVGVNDGNSQGHLCYLASTEMWPTGPHLCQCHPPLSERPSGQRPALPGEWRQCVANIRGPCKVHQMMLTTGKWLTWIARRCWKLRIVVHKYPGKKMGTMLMSVNLFPPLLT